MNLRRVDWPTSYGAEFQVPGSGAAITAIILGLQNLERVFPTSCVTIFSDGYEYSGSVSYEEALHTLSVLHRGNDWFTVLVSEKPIDKPWFSNSEEIYPFPVNTKIHNLSLVELHSFDSGSVRVVSTDREVVEAVASVWEASMNSTEMSSVLPPRAVLASGSVLITASFVSRKEYQRQFSDHFLVISSGDSSLEFRFTFKTAIEEFARCCYRLASQLQESTELNWHGRVPLAYGEIILIYEGKAAEVGRLSPYDGVHFRILSSDSYQVHGLSLFLKKGEAVEVLHKLARTAEQYADGLTDDRMKTE